MVFAVIVVVWIVIAVLAFILVGGIIIAVQNRRKPEDLGELEADRAAAQASLASDAQRRESGTTAIRDQEGRFN